MLTKTVNELVREVLLEKQLPMHYYVPKLHLALNCLEELSLDLNISTNVKEAEATILSHDRVAIPSTAIDVVNVFGLYGGQRKGFFLNEDLTKIVNLDGATEIPYEKDETSIPEFNNSDSSTLSDGSNIYQTVFYPGDNYKYEYNIDKNLSQIILKPGHGLTKIYIQYLENGVSKTSANVLHPYVSQTVKSWIDYKFSDTDGSPQSAIAIKRGEYYNQKRILRGRINQLSIKDAYLIID